MSVMCPGNMRDIELLVNECRNFFMGPYRAPGVLYERHASSNLAEILAVFEKEVGYYKDQLYFMCNCDFWCEHKAGPGIVVPLHNFVKTDKASGDLFVCGILGDITEDFEIEIIHALLDKITSKKMRSLFVAAKICSNPDIRNLFKPRGVKARGYIEGGNAHVHIKAKVYLFPFSCISGEYILFNELFQMLRESNLPYEREEMKLLFAAFLLNKRLFFYKIRSPVAVCKSYGLGAERAMVVVGTMFDNLFTDFLHNRCPCERKL